MRALSMLAPAKARGAHGRVDVARRLGLSAGALSRLMGRGHGTSITGEVILRLAPNALEVLGASRRVALVSGTNGKTTTAHMLATALRTLQPVAANDTGSNMPSGLVSALAVSPDTEVAVLEVDEPYLPRVVASLAPTVTTLINLSRDQLDRMTEVGRLVQAWRSTFTEGSTPGQGTVVANCDDPLIVWAAANHPHVVWVAAGQSWTEDSMVCPSCSGSLERVGDGEWSSGCGFRRPAPAWTVDADSVQAPGGRRVPMPLALPGSYNRGNAALALAAAEAMGVDLALGARALAAVTSVQGRYTLCTLGGHPVRLLLAKNPASWLETLTLLSGSGAPVVLVVNSRAADGRDVSWLWDVAFERLRGTKVVASGERRYDLAVRLGVAGVSHVVVDHPIDFLRTTNQRIDVVATYTAFQDLRRAADA